jgi:sirohydrochlorin cobaltochelatase
MPAGDSTAALPARQAVSCDPKRARHEEGPMTHHMEQVHLPPVVLLAHGSSDPAWAAPVRGLLDRLAAAEPTRPVRLAFMESAEPRLSETVRELTAEGHHHVAVIPVFLSSGGPHMRRDVPALVREAQRDFPGLTLELLGGALAEEPEVLDAMARAALRRVARWRPA